MWKHWAGETRQDFILYALRTLMRESSMSNSWITISPEIACTSVSITWLELFSFSLFLGIKVKTSLVLFVWQIISPGATNLENWLIRRVWLGSVFGCLVVISINSVQFLVNRVKSKPNLNQVSIWVLVLRIENIGFFFIETEFIYIK